MTFSDQQIKMMGSESENYMETMGIVVSKTFKTKTEAVGAMLGAKDSVPALLFAKIDRLDVGRRYRVVAWIDGHSVPMELSGGGVEPVLLTDAFKTEARKRWDSYFVAP